MPQHEPVPSDRREGVLAALAAHCGMPVTDQTDATLATLGLDSLGRLRLGRDIAAATGVDVPVSHLLGGATVADVLAAVEEAAGAAAEGTGAAAGSTGAVSEDAVGRELAPPESSELTVVQQAYWAGRGDDFAGGGAATFWYHEYERGPAQRDGRDLAEDHARIETAWKRVVAHHDMLRTTIDRHAMPRVATYDVRDWHMPLHDLGHLPPAEAQARALELRHRLSHQVRPTDTWPLIDVVAIVLPGERVRYCVGFDALLVDFTAWGLVMRQWGQLVRRPQWQLPQPATTFRAALRRRADDTDRRRRRARDRSWWRAQDVPAAPLGGRFPQGPRRVTRHRRVVDAQTWAEVRALARERGVSPTCVVLTAFALATHRWGRDRDGGLTLNLTVFDRPDEAADIVGDFSTTALLPLTGTRGFAPQSPVAFEGTARAVERRLWEVLEHRSYGGIEVARDRPGQGPWPIVVTSGLGQSSGTDDAWLGERVFGVSQTPQVCWDHLLWEEEGALVLTHDVVDDIWPPALVDGVIEMQAALVRSLAAPAGWTRPAPGWEPRAEVIPAAARHPGAGPLLHDPWVEATQRHAGRPALIAGDQMLTHDDLLRRGEQVAAGLRRRGVGPGDLVLVVLPKGVEQIVTVLGVMLTGAGYVPADPGWPLTRLAAVRRRTRLTLAVAAAGIEVPEGVTAVTPSELAGRGSDAEDLHSGEASEQAPSQVRGTHARPEADELAYVIFTSGSTGEPKGVAVEHRQARTTVDEVNARYDIGPDDRVLAVSALSFDLSVYDIFGVLARGGAMVLPEPDRSRDPQHWLDLMAEHRVSLWNSAPPLMEMLLEYAESVPEAATTAFAGLRHCLLSGDWIPVTLPDRLRRFAPGCAVHSLGGATEASIWSITYPIGEVDPAWPSIPYGRALPGQSFWVLDNGQPALVGEEGELFIGGDGVARGYIGAPELTAQRFLPRPDLGTRLYRTGDLGRWRRDGQIEFLGRVDRQVKVGGHRIELGEVEGAMLRLPHVRQAVAASVPGPDGRPRLVAYVSGHGTGWAHLPTTEQRRIGAQLAQGLRERLPAYMVPSTFVTLDELPTTENGKVDYKGLPDPFASRARGAAAADVRAEVPAAAPREAPDAAPTGAANGPMADAGPAARPDQGLRPAAEGQGHTPGPADDRVATAVRGIIGHHASFELSPAQNGVTSLQLVRLANAVEDLGLPRPPMAELLGASPLVELVHRWGAALGVAEPIQAPEPEFVTERAAPAEPVIGTEPAPGAERIELQLRGPAAPPVPDAVVAAPGPGGEDTPQVVGCGPGTLADLARRLRRAADLIEQAQTQIQQAHDLAGVPGAYRLPAAPGAVQAPPALAEVFDLTEMQLAYLVGRAPDEYGRSIAPHYYTEVLVTDLDPDRLRDALATVLQRHPMLRASITPDTRQWIDAMVAVPFEVVDLRRLDADGQQGYRDALRAQRSHRVLPPQRAPMLWVTAARVSERGWQLFVDLDLLFCDAASAVIVADEVSGLYRGEDLAAPPAVSFSQWVRDEADAAGSVERRAAQRYWSGAVSRLPDPVLPPQRADRTPGTSGFVRHRFELSAQAWAAVRRAAAAAGVTVSCLLLHELGGALSPNRRGTVMATVSRRPQGHAGVVGDYTATVPVSLGGPDADLRAEQADLAEAFEHALTARGLHGNDVLRMLRAAGRPATVPIAVSLAVDPAAVDASQLFDEFGSTEYAISQTPQVLVDVQVFDVAGRFVTNVDVDEAVVDPAWSAVAFGEWTRRLRKLSGMGAEATGEAAVPDPARSRLRDDLGEVFAELLGDIVLADRASWFEQGATSVTLVTAQRMLRERGHAIDIVDLFTYPSPAALVAAKGGGSAVPAPQATAPFGQPGHATTPPPAPTPDTSPAEPGHRPGDVIMSDRGGHRVAARPPWEAARDRAERRRGAR